MPLRCDACNIQVVTTWLPIWFLWCEADSMWLWLWLDDDKDGGDDDDIIVILASVILNYVLLVMISLLIIIHPLFPSILRIGAVLGPFHPCFRHPTCAFGIVRGPCGIARNVSLIQSLNLGIVFFSCWILWFGARRGGAHTDIWATAKTPAIHGNTKYVLDRHWFMEIYGNC